MGLNAALPDKEGAPAFFWGSSQAFADRLAEALTSQVFKETKTTGRAAGKGGRPVAKKNDLPNEKEDILKGTEWEKKNNILNRWRSATF